MSIYIHNQSLFYMRFSFETENYLFHGLPCCAIYIYRTLLVRVIREMSVYLLFGVKYKLSEDFLALISTLQQNILKKIIAVSLIMRCS